MLDAHFGCFSFFLCLLKKLIETIHETVGVTRTFDGIRFDLFSIDNKLLCVAKLSPKRSI